MNVLVKVYRTVRYQRIPRQRLLLDEDDREYSCHRYFIATTEHGAKEWRVAIDGCTADLEKVWERLSKPGPFTPHAFREQTECFSSGMRATASDQAASASHSALLNSHLSTSRMPGGSGDVGRSTPFHFRCGTSR